MDESARQEVFVAWPVDERRRLLEAERASLHLRKGESGLAELVELGKISAGSDDVDLGVCTDVCEAELVNLAEQRSALGEGQAREGDLGRLGRGGPYRVGVAVHMPKSGSSSTNHPPGASQVTIRRSRSTLGDICMSTARVCMRSKELGGNVSVRMSCRRTSTFEASISVRNPNCRSVAITRPVAPTTSDSHRGDRPSPPTDLQTPSALPDSKTLNAPLRKGVETLLQQLKTARFVLGGVRERVVRCLTHSQNRKPRYSSPSGLGSTFSASWQRGWRTRLEPSLLGHHLVATDFGFAEREGVGPRPLPQRPGWRSSTVKPTCLRAWPPSWTRKRPVKWPRMPAPVPPSCAPRSAPIRFSGGVADTPYLLSEEPTQMITVLQ